jgi:biotin operon repressor
MDSRIPFIAEGNPMLPSAAAQADVDARSWFPLSPADSAHAMNSVSAGTSQQQHPQQVQQFAQAAEAGAQQEANGAADEWQHPPDRIMAEMSEASQGQQDEAAQLEQVRSAFTAPLDDETLRQILGITSQDVRAAIAVLRDNGVPLTQAAQQLAAAESDARARAVESLQRCKQQEQQQAAEQVVAMDEQKQALRDMFVEPLDADTLGHVFAASGNDVAAAAHMLHESGLQMAHRSRHSSKHSSQNGVPRAPARSHASSGDGGAGAWQQLEFDSAENGSDDDFAQPSGVQHNAPPDDEIVLGALHGEDQARARQLLYEKLYGDAQGYYDMLKALKRQLKDAQWRQDQAAVDDLQAQARGLALVCCRSVAWCITT